MGTLLGVVQAEHPTFFPRAVCTARSVGTFILMLGKNLVAADTCVDSERLAGDRDALLCDCAIVVRGLELIHKCSLLKQAACRHDYAVRKCCRPYDAETSSL